MKKLYSKPEIMFEDFTLSVHIAGDCNVIINTSSDNVCGFLDTRDPTAVPVFMDGISGCSRKEPDGFNGVCYHNPTETSDLFNS